jgi:DNA modification methylase
MPDNSFDSIVTDPPYGMKFMGQRWDYDVPSVAVWQEALRVLKPGGHLLAFSGTRTYHRMVTNIEDGGFEIRDQLMWVYGSGMPKSKNLHDDWEGFGTALKPSHEPICLARKPISEKTVEANVLKHGTGAMNINGCRVALQGAIDASEFENNHRVTERLPDSYEGRPLGLHAGGWKQIVGKAVIPTGRWPANLLHDGSDEVIECFPQSNGQQGDLVGHMSLRKSKGIFGDMAAADHIKRGDSGSAARFFYSGKATKVDREEGLSDLPDSILARSTQAQADAERGVVIQDGEGAFNKARLRKNNHPTVKPTDVCRWLLRLVTPPGGRTLDMYCGSGSFGKAAMLEGFNFVGIDLDEDEHGEPLGFLDISRARITHAQAVAFDNEMSSEEL